MENTSNLVLLIEDEDLIQKLIIKLCARRGLRVTTAGDAEQIQACEKRLTDYAMFIVDLRLPGISGRDILRRIKAHPVAGTRPAIVLTGAVLAPAERKELEQIADMVVMKKQISIELFDEIFKKYLPVRPTAGVSGNSR